MNIINNNSKFPINKQFSKIKLNNIKSKKESSFIEKYNESNLNINKNNSYPSNMKIIINNNLVNNKYKSFFVKRQKLERNISNIELKRKKLNKIINGINEKQNNEKNKRKRNNSTQNFVKISLFIKPIKPSFERDFSKINNEENELLLENKAKAFIRKIHVMKKTNETINKNREKKILIRKIREDNKIFENQFMKYRNKNFEKKNLKVNNSIDLSYRKNTNLLVKKIINKKYHYYNPDYQFIRNKKQVRTNRGESHSQDQIILPNINNNLSRINKEEIFKDISCGEINVSLFKYYTPNYLEKKDNETKDNNNNNISLLNTSFKRSPYFFNDPKYYISYKDLKENQKKEKKK